jgi:hypothetical protein
MFEVLGLFRFLQALRARRKYENLSQRELLKREAKLLAAALLVIVLLMGGLFALAWFILR